MGQFKKGVRNGRGVNLAMNGTLYIGYWKDDKKQIYGKEVTESGEIYEGQFLDGQYFG